jgi:hypothetical protein
MAILVVRATVTKVIDHYLKQNSRLAAVALLNWLLVPDLISGFCLFFIHPLPFWKTNLFSQTEKPTFITENAAITENFTPHDVFEAAAFPKTINTSKTDLSTLTRCFVINNNIIAHLFDFVKF